MQDTAAEVVEGLQGTSLFLVGMMGSGKSTVGRLVAQALSYCFFDTGALAGGAQGYVVAPVIFRAAAGVGAASSGLLGPRAGRRASCNTVNPFRCHLLPARPPNPTTACPHRADQLIEQITSKQVKDIFAEDGEENFREIETQVLAVSGPVACRRPEPRELAACSWPLFQTAWAPFGGAALLRWRKAAAICSACMSPSCR